MNETVLEIAQQAASDVWTQPETSHIEMDVRLATEFTRVLSFWIDCYAQAERNTEFYRDLLDECANYLGPAVFMADDGSVSDSPLRLKIPELVKALAARYGEGKRTD